MECRQHETDSRNSNSELENRINRILNPRSSPFVRLDPLLRLPCFPQRLPIDTHSRCQCSPAASRHSTPLSHARSTFSKVLDSPFRCQTVQQTFRDELQGDHDDYDGHLYSRRRFPSLS